MSAGIETDHVVRWSPLGSARLALMEAGHQQVVWNAPLDEAIWRLGNRLSALEPDDCGGASSVSGDNPQGIALAVDASEILGRAAVIARQESDEALSCALLFLTSALLVSESLGGSCVALSGGDVESALELQAQQLPVLLSALGATRDEAENALALADGKVKSAVIGEADKPERWPLVAEMIGGRRFLFQEKPRRLEANLAKDLAARVESKRISDTSSPGASDAPQRPEGVSEMANREQLLAVNAVLEALREAAQRAAKGEAHPAQLVVITGGPGTGKTFTVAQILRAIDSDSELSRLLDERAIALTAPTGKAADRMEESIAHSLTANEAGPESSRLIQWIQDEEVRPRTIHRLLGANPLRGTFRFHQNNPLPAKLVISDEASMIGLELMERLLRSVEKGAVFVLLGDENQLPSVEAGAVLRDVCGLSGIIRNIVRLTETKRQNNLDPGGYAISMAANALNAGEVPHEKFLQRRTRARDIAFQGVELFDPQAGQADETGEDTSAGGASELLERWFGLLTSGARTFAEAAARASSKSDGFAQELGHAFQTTGGSAFLPGEILRLRGIFDALLRQKILTFTRAQRGLLNARLHQRHLSWLQKEGVWQGPLRGNFLPGEPVMMLRNDPSRGIFNGDQGIVLRVQSNASKPRLCAVFKKNEGFMAFPVSELEGDIEHAFAMTIHKSQGSEYDAVLVTLPKDSAMPLLSREIAYTALTRAKKSAVFWGSEAVLSAAAERRASDQRVSALGCRLRCLLGK